MEYQRMMYILSWLECVPFLLLSLLLSYIHSLPAFRRRRQIVYIIILHMLYIHLLLNQISVTKSSLFYTHDRRMHVFQRWLIRGFAARMRFYIRTRLSKEENLIALNILNSRTGPAISSPVEINRIRHFSR